MKRLVIAQVDGKWPNLALAKYASWARSRGLEVSWFYPGDRRAGDFVVASKTFFDTPDDERLPERGVLRGGSGYSLKLELPPEVESLRPDWSLWPKWDKDMGFTTRGCVRHCPFCIVPKKEGKIRVVAEFGDIWTGRDEVTLLDNNLTAAPPGHFRAVFADARKARVKINFCQGFDARLWNDEHQAVVKEFSPVCRRFHFAFDNMRDEKAVRRLVKMWTAAGMHPDRLVFFVLVGFDTTPEEDAYRVNLLISLKTNPFVMPFNRSDEYQRRLARWCNSVVARKSCSFDEFSEQTRQKIAAAAR